MSNNFKLSITSTMYRVILLSLLILKASSGPGLTPKVRGALIFDIGVFLWLLPFIVVSITKASLANSVQPFIVLNYDRIVNTIFKILLTLFFLLAFIR